MPKLAGVEIWNVLIKNPLFLSAFVGLFTNGTARCSVQPSRFPLFVVQNFCLSRSQSFILQGCSRMVHSCSYKYRVECTQCLFIYLLTYLVSYLLTYLLTCLLAPWSRVLHEKLTGYQLVKKFPAFYGTRRFITVFASARHLSLS
jgi:hypothetical protein